MKRPAFAELLWWIEWMVLASGTLVIAGCAQPAPKPQPQVETAAERQRQAELLADFKKRRAELKAEEEAREAAKQAEYKQRLSEQLAERQRVRDAVPEFQAQLKAGDRVAARSAYALGTVIELKRPLALVQLEIVENFNLRFEMRWVPVADLWPPIIWAPGR